MLTCYVKLLIINSNHIHEPRLYSKTSISEKEINQCPAFCVFLLYIGLWSVINNAGLAISGPLDWQSLNDMKTMADVNLWGLIDVTKTFLPLLKKSKGRLINVASIAGEI